MESAKAGAVAALGGLLGSLPYLANAGHSAGSTALSAAQVAASCLLFGVTFRYVASAGAANAQLKAGVVGAFGLVRGCCCPLHALPFLGRVSICLGKSLSGCMHARWQVRGMAYADAAQQGAATAGGSPVSTEVLGSSALAAGESMLTFGFAAAAVEAALRAGLVKPFGMALARD